LQHIDKTGPDVILIDSERLVGVVEAVRKHNPRVRIVLDADDLLSRRYGELARLEAPINFGFLRQSLPNFLRGAELSPALAKIFYKSEASGLKDVEKRLASAVDVAVFVSPAEAVLFNRQSQTARAVGILPPLSRKPAQLPSLEVPFHFIFVGSDALEQNAMTISYLLDLWRRKHIRHSLKVFGRQTRVWRETANVTFEGFARNLEDIYTKGAILLAPSFLPGGIKTKVVEALGYGAPVLGNEVSFEGLGVDYPLCFKKMHALEDFVSDIQSHAQDLRQARDVGLAYASVNCTVSSYKAQWQAVIGARIDILRNPANH
jgi:hypothetical protein